MDFYIALAFCMYATILIGIGLFFYQRDTSIETFTLGKRSSHYFVTAIATQASDMSAWLMLGFPAAVYMHGYHELWTVFGLILFMFLSWHIVAPNLRKQSEIYNSVTLSGLFSAYYKDTNNMLGFTSAAISTYFFICYIASGLVGLGEVFEKAFQLQYQFGICLGLCITLLYTILGGFLAISLANTFQGIFLLVMIILVPLCAWISIPFSNNVLQQAEIIIGKSSLIGSLILSLSWGLGYFGQPHILTYFMGIDNPENIRYAKYVGMAWHVCALTASAAIGLLGLAIFGQLYSQPELLFVTLATQLFHPFILGCMLCAIVAAVLSTMSSHILITGSVLATDFLPTVYKKYDTKTQVMYVRFFSCIASLCALFISWQHSTSIYNLVNYAWSGLGASFGPLVLILLYNIQIECSTALAGLITGALVSGLWPLTGSNLFPLIPGFVTNFTVMYIVNNYTKTK